MSERPERRHTEVLGIPIAAANTEIALAWIAEDLQSGRKGYVCFTSVHGLMEARRDARVAASYAAASLCLPDGAPVAWVGRWQGEEQMQRVAGPEFMLNIFGDERFKRMKHFLYGGDTGVAAALQKSLQERYPESKIVGTFTPPFRDLNIQEELDLESEIRTLHPDIIWVGIGCPKQEKFMQRYIDRLDTRLMLGVGAAFDFHTGRIQDSPEWVKRAGLQWLHRLLQDPRRLWRRYCYSNSAFLWNLALQFIGFDRSVRKEVLNDSAAQRNKGVAAAINR